MRASRPADYEGRTPTRQVGQPASKTGPMHASSTPDDHPASRRPTLSVFALAVGIVFFAFSLTPSLIPRDYVLQGVLGGVVMALGYGLGQFGLLLWRYVELPLARDRLGRVLNALALVVAGLTVAIGSAVAPAWCGAENPECSIGVLVLWAAAGMAAGAVVGQVMKATRGQADAARVRELILEKLGVQG